MMTKRIGALLILMTIILPFTGCYNYREIEHLAIVAGCAVDKGTSGNKFHLTIELIDLGSGGKNAEIKSKLVETDGLTVFEAMRNAESMVSRELYWSNCQIIIISPDVAREGILQILDCFKRAHEPRPTIDVAISETPLAKEILSQKSINSPVISFELDKAVESNPKRLSSANYIELYKILNLLSVKEDGLTLPAVKNVMNDKDQIWKLNGCALFNGDKLVGFLDAFDTKYMLFVTNSVKGGVIPENAGGGNVNNATLEIYKNETQMTPEYKDGKLTIKIDTNTTVELVDIETGEDLTCKENREKLCKKVKSSIELNIKRVVGYVQKNYGTDVFGFGEMISKKDPKLWSKLKDNWKENFKNLEVLVNSKVVIKNSGLTEKPIKAGGQE